uniref:Uncharacterized protein n=1 Tax=Triticum urartu TaxID=4572 RepID=A0A8R7V7I6_TRIUA
MSTTAGACPYLLMNSTKTDMNPSLSSP